MGKVRDEHEEALQLVRDYSLDVQERERSQCYEKEPKK